MKRSYISVIGFCAIMALPVSAQDFSAGLAAYEEGDYLAALDTWQPLAEQGNADAQYYLGRVYANGNGVPEDYAEAVRWYRLAGEQGHAEALNRLVDLMRLGRGSPQGFAEAVHWLRTAGEQGHVYTQFYLGVTYEIGGLGVPRDYLEAARWYRMAAEQGYAPAQYFLGNLYERGEGVRQDYVEAFRWYRLVAERADDYADWARLNLSDMYRLGHGVPEDFVLSHMWLNIAVALGTYGARSSLRNLERQMTREQIADAQVRARLCMSSGYEDCD